MWCLRRQVYYPNRCIVLYIVYLMADSNAYFLDRRETDGRYNAIYSTQFMKANET